MDQELQQGSAIMPATQGTIADRISAVIGSLTGAEKRTARVLLARYPVMGLESVTPSPIKPK
jgi:hypothetical protein